MGHPAAMQTQGSPFDSPSLALGLLRAGFHCARQMRATGLEVVGLGL